MTMGKTYISKADILALAYGLCLHQCFRGASCLSALEDISANFLGMVVKLFNGCPVDFEHVHHPLSIILVVGSKITNSVGFT